MNPEQPVGAGRHESRRGEPRPRHTIATDAAPKAIGPYAQAILSGGLVFTAGQLGVDPETGQLADGVAAQTTRALANLQAVLRAAGADLDTVVKTTVFLAEMADFAAMNEVYATWFGATVPARSTVAVRGLPLGALVEIEAVAGVGA